MIRLLVFFLESFNDPRGVILLMTARRLLRGWALVEATMLSIILTALLAGVFELVRPLGGRSPTPAYVWVLSGFVSLWVSTVLTYAIARCFGGKATFTNTLVANVWLQLILSVLQVGTIFAYLVMPGLATVWLLVMVVITFYLFSNFVAEINGFSSAVNTFLFTAMFLIGIAIVLTSLAVSIGGQPGGG